MLHCEIMDIHFILFIVSMNFMFRTAVNHVKLASISLRCVLECLKWFKPLVLLVTGTVDIINFEIYKLICQQMKFYQKPN